MNLKYLTDQELLKQTKESVSKERELLTQVLHHLKEVERRRLFSDLGCQSLFEYAVKELKYSEGQAGRRIQAMRLLKELPELESKIKAGSLSLSNISQAQSYFRESKKASKPLSTEAKAEVLTNLENKSAREGQKLIFQLQPQSALLKEKERLVSSTHTEIRFIMSEELKIRLEEVRSFLGPKGALMSFSELIEEMAKLSIRTLKIKKFGIKRTLLETDALSPMANPIPAENMTTPPEATAIPLENKTISSETKNNSSDSTPTPELPPQSSRYISKALRHKLWIRDKGQCTNCGGRRNLNVDHIKPLGMGGTTELANLRLLCFHCNQRHATKSFGRFSPEDRLSK